MHTKHTVAWVDHHEAKVLRLHESPRFEAAAIHGPHGQTHNKHANDGHRAQLDAGFAARIAQALGDTDEILLCGPSSAKDELVRLLRASHPEVASRIVGVEPADHPTERQLADHARRFFVRSDRMHGSRVG